MRKQVFNSTARPRDLPVLSAVKGTYRKPPPLASGYRIVVSTKDPKD